MAGRIWVSTQINMNLLNILAMIAFAYCVIKIFFANIKRGGIFADSDIGRSIIYMFSVPEGIYGRLQPMDEASHCNMSHGLYANYAFIPRFAYLPGNMLLGLGIMLAANEVPKLPNNLGLIRASEST